MAYAKGSKPQEMDAAKGGVVLERTQNWQKDPDPDFHPLGTGMLGPFNTKDYSSKGKPAIRQGDTKEKTAIKPRS